MIKLKNILNESILIQRRSKEERLKFHRVLIYKQIRQYIKNGSKGSLNLSKEPIEYLPNKLKYVEGNLYLSNSLIKKLPDGLVIQNDLWLDYCPIEEYPTNIKVGGWVSLSYTKITKLPDNLNINNDLWIDHTNISEIPNNLNIKGTLRCSNSLLSKKYTAALINQMIINNGGSVSNVFL